jgi:lipoprotein-releasing system ATP-binding protein
MTAAVRIGATGLADMLLQLEKVSKIYDAVTGGGGTSGGASGGLPVLRDVSLSIERGQTLAIVGPSGSGKSTLLNIIGTLDRPSSGRVLLEGRDLAALNDQELALLRNRRIGWVFQSHHLLPQLGVLENVLVPTLAEGKEKQDSRKTGQQEIRRGQSEGGTSGGEAENEGEDVLSRAKRLLARVGLADRMSHRPGQLSGGERQRVAVVRALINSPALVLADEPTGALDQHHAENLADLLVELNRAEGAALVVVTHSLSLAARMGTVMTLREGTLAPRPPA